MIDKLDFLLEDVSSEFIGLSVAFGFHSIEPTRVSKTPIDISTPQSLFPFFLFEIKRTLLHWLELNEIVILQILLFRMKIFFWKFYRLQI